MKIYTKTGDDGSTGLASGQRVPKDCCYVETYGSIDELNCFLGFSLCVCKDEELRKIIIQIQHDLFTLGTDLATPLDAEIKIERISPERSARLEKNIDHYTQKLAELKNFILPGGEEFGARLHLSRSVARRAERRLISHVEENKVNKETVIYLNRLSDLLFVLARYANHIDGCGDTLWDKNL